MLHDTTTIEHVQLSAYRIPTDYPESDGTFAWDHTNLILVELTGGGKTGFGYTYGHRCITDFIVSTLNPLLIGAACMDIAAVHRTLVEAVRNEGQCGLTAMAIAAVDNALWDLKARILQVPLTALLGAAREGMPVYGSGGFTSYPLDKLTQQMETWANQGFRQLKMKVGRHPEKDVKRVRAVRKAVGDQVALFVDANGAYGPKEALEMAGHFADLGVSWFEEPVRSDNLRGLHFVRQHAPGTLRIVAGEYGYRLSGFAQLLDAGAVDILQADATRCGGLSTFMKAGDLCETYQIPFSSHCAPALHLSAAIAVPAFYTGEYFYDHARIEDMLFEGSPRPRNGKLYSPADQPGNGLTFKRADAKRYQL